ncbi:hypothetical protein GCM10027447_31430 [Glycomyces halotolerans]
MSFSLLVRLIQLSETTAWVTVPLTVVAVLVTILLMLQVLRMAFEDLTSLFTPAWGKALAFVQLAAGLAILADQVLRVVMLFL